MAKARDSFATALSALRSQLRDGVFGPGEPLLASELANALAISITPVREALAHLAGEQLIGERRGRGYFAPTLEASDLEGLYHLHGLYVAAAISHGRPYVESTPEFEASAYAAEHDPNGPHGQRGAIEAVFAGIVRSTANTTLVQAHLQTVNRLAVARLHEAAILEEGAIEVGELAAAWREGDVGPLKEIADRYHARRVFIAPRIAARLRAATHYYRNII